MRVIPGEVGCIGRFVGQWDVWALSACRLRADGSRAAGTRSMHHLVLQARECSHKQVSLCCSLCYLVVPVDAASCLVCLLIHPTLPLALVLLLLLLGA
jgi:hypothetical protein